MRIGYLSTCATPCGLAEHGRHLVHALRRQDEVEVVWFGSRNYGARAVEEPEPGVVQCFDVGLWHPERRSQLDVDAILDHRCDALIVSYEALLYNVGQLTSLLGRFQGVRAAIWHDNCLPADLPVHLLDLTYAHRPGVGPGGATVIPFGIDHHPPVVKTFGLGRSREDLILPVCERNGWRFEASFGERAWKRADELHAWLRDSDAIVLWYDDAPAAGASQAVRSALATRRPVVVNDTTWFADVPERGRGIRKVATLAELEHELRQTLRDPYDEGETWDAVAGRLADDLRTALAARERTAA